MAFQPQLNTWGGAARYAKPTPSNPAPAQAPAQPAPAPQPSASDIAYSSPTIAPQLAANDTNLADTYTGLGVSFDPSGAPVYSGGSYFQGAQNFGVDESGNLIAQGDTRFNPFSEAELMKKAFNERKNATVNSYAGRNQLYAGSLNNAQTGDATSYAQNYNALQRNAEGYYSGLVNKARGARDTAAMNTAGMTGQAVADFTAAHVNDPAPPAPKKPPLGFFGRFNKQFEANLAKRK